MLQGITGITLQMPFQKSRHPTNETIGNNDLRVGNPNDCVVVSSAAVDAVGDSYDCEDV